MMGNRKKYLGFLLCLILLSFIVQATAATFTPMADSVFSRTSVSVNTSMSATFSATAQLVCESISVTSCTLQVKNGSTWSNVGSVTPPSAVAENTTVYGAVKGYSSYCTSGKTYRLKAVFTADGHSLTSYSNEAAYN
jgi:hypothetical protein